MKINLTSLTASLRRALQTSRTWPLAVTVLILSSALAEAGSATWKSIPADGNWNNPRNWMPRTVPNGSTDVATLGISSGTDLTVSETTEVASLVFAPGASAYSIASAPTIGLTMSGAGIQNNSGTVQNFVATPGDFGVGSFNFINEATAGSSTSFLLEPGTFPGQGGGLIQFFGNASAGEGTFVISGAVNIEGGTGTLVFWDSSNAGTGDFTLTAGTGPASSLVQLRDNSSAGNADFSSNGVIYFIGEAEAGMATINLRGAATSEQAAGVLLMSDNTSAGSATIVGAGGAAESSTGAGIFFFGSADAANATLMASGDLSSASGGQIYFYETSTGGAATFVLSGRGGLDISLHVPPGLTIGALQGDGTVLLGANTLVLDNRGSTEFAGVLTDGGIAGGVGGSLAKINGGTLTLSGPNSYTGGTIVSDGTLLASTKRGSSTGTGPVAVDAGTLGGTSTLTGPITVGTGNGAGASIAPGVNGPGRLSTRGSITFQADATYLFELSSSQRKADQISARGATISSGALFSFVEIGNRPLSAGTVFIVINNTSRNPIAGTFSNLPDGSSFASNGKNFAVSYTSGTGNDLTLTVLP